MVIYTGTVYFGPGRKGGSCKTPDQPKSLWGPLSPASAKVSLTKALHIPGYLHPIHTSFFHQCPMTYDVNCAWLEPAPGRGLGQFFGGDFHLAGNIGLAANIPRTAHPPLHF